MLTLVLLFIVVLIVVSLVSRMARASRRHAREAEQRRLAELQQSGGEPVSPFSMFPFGGILDEMMRGMETRSYTIDPETGEWVEMTEEQPPASEPEPVAAGSAARGSGSRASGRRAPRR